MGVAHEELHVASLLVLTPPNNVCAVRTAIASRAGAEIQIDDRTGKLVVTLEAASEADILAHIERIQAVPGVLSAALVYHEVEIPDAGK